MTGRRIKPRARREDSPEASNSDDLRRIDLRTHDRPDQTCQTSTYGTFRTDRPSMVLFTSSANSHFLIPLFPPLSPPTSGRPNCKEVDDVPPEVEKRGMGEKERRGRRRKVKSSLGRKKLFFGKRWGGRREGEKGKMGGGRNGRGGGGEGGKEEVGKGESFFYHRQKLAVVTASLVRTVSKGKWYSEYIVRLMLRFFSPIIRGFLCDRQRKSFDHFPPSFSFLSLPNGLSRRRKPRSHSAADR